MTGKIRRSRRHMKGPRPAGVREGGAPGSTRRFNTPVRLTLLAAGLEAGGWSLLILGGLLLHSLSVIPDCSAAVTTRPP